MYRVIEIPAPKAMQEVPIMYRGVDISNLDFPILCTFRHEEKAYVGILNKNWMETGDYYELHHALQRAEHR